MKALPVLQPQPPKPKFDCLSCPGYCCSYDVIEVTNKDIRRLAEHFQLAEHVAREKFTQDADGQRILKHRKDSVYPSVCQFLHPVARICTVYAARPGVCRSYPAETRCRYYEFVQWERKHQDDPTFTPLSV